VAKKKILNKISVYIPGGKMEQRLVQRLNKLADKKDHSINHLVVEAIIQYINREDEK